MNRRDFLISTGRTAGAVVAVAAASGMTAKYLAAQTAEGAQGAPSAASNVEMSEEAYKPVRRPAKPNAKPTMTKAEIDVFEVQLACPCPCTQDVYTCRMTDFTCGIAPAVHGDVEVLVNGGYTADEIMTAMTDTYGDFILMTPRKQGFNLLAWIAPFTAIGVGTLAIGGLLRGWRKNALSAAQARDAARQRQPVAPDPTDDATPEELERLQAALRGDR